MYVFSLEFSDGASCVFALALLGAFFFPAVMLVVGVEVGVTIELPSAFILASFLSALSVAMELHCVLFADIQFNEFMSLLFGVAS